ncbi:MAG: tRNA pseudouridine synthase A [Acidobacteriaceae bacterium]
MRTFKLVLTYDGTDFHGWQVQPGLVTVQGALAQAIHRVTGESVLPQGSGRTDAGVHAEAQVASFSLSGSIPPENLLQALNRALPLSIRVLSSEHAEAHFHARHSARGKTYEYRIHEHPPCSPMLARYVYACPWPLRIERLQAAARIVVGEHDFTSFAASDPDKHARLAKRDAAHLPHAAMGAEAASDSEPSDSNLRTIFESQWERRGELLVYSVRGSGFLHHMVRNLVGTFIEAGRGRLNPEEIAAILCAQDRSFAGPTAPARGLFLKHVEY